MLQIPDFLLQIPLGMLQVQGFLLQVSLPGPPWLHDMQHINAQMLQVSLELQLTIVYLLQVKVVLLQVDVDLQQNNESGDAAIVRERPIQEAGALGIFEMLQVGLVLQQIGPEVLQIRRRAPPPMTRGGARSHGGNS